MVRATRRVTLAQADYMATFVIWWELRWRPLNMQSERCYERYASHILINADVTLLSTDGGRLHGDAVIGAMHYALLSPPGAMFGGNILYITGNYQGCWLRVTNVSHIVCAALMSRYRRCYSTRAAAYCYTSRYYCGMSA